MTKVWVVTASAVSNMGMYISGQTTSAYQLQGMAEQGWLPSCFAERSRCGTPTAGLALGLSIVLGLSGLDFLAIVDLLNGVYCLAQLLEFAAFVRLRHKHPGLERPFRVPLPTCGCVAMLLAPVATALLILVMPVLVGDWPQVACLVAAPLLSLLCYCLLEACRRRGWAHFLRDPPRDLEELLALQAEEHHEGPGIEESPSGSDGAQSSEGDCSPNSPG